MSRLFIVSNRLPVSIRHDPDGRPGVVASAGGLATGLAGPHRESEGLWFGWPGHLDRLPPAERDTVARLLAERRIVPVSLTRKQVHGFYDGFSNGVLWPLFHYFLDRVPLTARGWEEYVEANERFAELVAAEWRPGDRIWVHDYQLALLPGMLRDRLPDARIGFFLHIPFPAVEVFRILPWRREILRGMLGADLVGFHTFSYLRHFRQSLLQVLELEAEFDTVALEGGRSARLGMFPMGIDAGAFSALADSPEVLADAADLRRRANGRRILLGVDRLDYTKGLPRRLLAFARLLERQPELREQVVLVQVAVPSREKLSAYRRYKSRVEELVGRINGRFGTAGWTPIRYLHRSVSPRRLSALYRAADVMLVTPLRDGMNLVAKEFVAGRPDNDGVLILSELAGAASELGEALRVNPYDVDGMAAAMSRALEMGPDERSGRIRALRARVMATDVHGWAAGFLRALDEAAPPAPAADPSPGASEPAAPATRIRAASWRLLLLDYDGTLVPLQDLPSLARPDGELLRLLRRLTELPHTRIEIISGRTPALLGEWFASVPVGLWAEHGFWRRPSPTDAWQSFGTPESAWKERVRPVLDHFAARTPGSFVEEKTAGLAFHYRLADPEFGMRQAVALRTHLNDLLANEPLQVLAGHKIVEIRRVGIDKGRVVRTLLEELGVEAPAAPGPVPAAGALFVAIGDDQTDEDLFAALPPGALTIRVGPGPTAARHRLADVGAVRRLLASLVA